MIQRLLSISVRSHLGRNFCTTACIKTKDKDGLFRHDLTPFDPFSPFISPEEHRERQKRLVSLVNANFSSEGKSERKVSSVILIPASRKSYQADTLIPLIHLKQNADFLYLTGFNTTDACNTILLLLGDGPSSNLENVPSSNSSDGPLTFKSIIFVPNQSSHQLIWEGSGMLASENSTRLSALCDEVRNIDTLPEFLVGLICDNKRHLLTSKNGVRLASDKKLASMAGNLAPVEKIKPGDRINNSSVNDVSPFIDQLRVIKSDAEMNAMKRAGLIGASALQSTIKWSRDQFIINEKKFDIPLINESQIASKFDYESRINGAAKVAYPSVCAGGQRSTIIHYGANNKFVSKSDWILMDAGCEDVEGYNSDITRCWSLSADSSSSKLQSDLYEALVETHTNLIKTLRTTPGVSLDQLFTIMCSALGKLLIEFGAISKSTSPNEASRMAFHFCPHHVSHYLGLDVHDTPSVSRNIPLRPGMAFTVEPGLYFRPNDACVKEQFKGIGLRVEDDLLIDSNGQIIVLTEKCERIN